MGKLKLSDWLLSVEHVYFFEVMIIFINGFSRRPVKNLVLMVQ